MTLNKAEKNWINIWNKTCIDRIPEWDQLSNVIFSFLITVIPSFVGKKVLEIGSGTGRISLKISQLRGADVILVDVSRRMIKYSKRLARTKGVSAEFIAASIFALPIKAECLDIIWSAGLLEHFIFERQQSAISECMRCLKESGKNVLIVPNKRSLIYNWLRVFSMKLGKWPYGHEEPLSRKDMNRFYPRPEYTYSAHGFLQLSSTVSVSIVSCGRILKGLLKIFHSMLGKGLYLINLLLPAYLLIGIFIKR